MSSNNTLIISKFYRYLSSALCIKLANILTHFLKKLLLLPSLLWGQI